MDYSDEAPPIPAHTMASMELVDQRRPTAGSGGGGGAKGGSKSPVIQEPLSSTYDVVGAITETVYEQPELPKWQPEPPKCELHTIVHGLFVMGFLENVFNGFLIDLSNF
jgi:hypothetical protein